MIVRRFVFLLSSVAVAGLVLSASAVVAQPSPKPFTVKTSGLQVVYPTPRPGDGKLPGAFSVKTGALSVVYPDAKTKTGAPAFKVTTSALTVVYPTPKGK